MSRQVWLSRARWAIAIVGALSFTACESTPTGPTPPGPTPGPSPAPMPVAASIQVTVEDGAMRPVSGATIEVEDATHQKTSKPADREGRASVDGSWINPVTIRVSREEFMPASQVQWLSAGEARLRFVLATTEQVQLPPGHYSLTFVMDSACSGGIPEPLRTRSYDATIQPFRSFSGGIYGYSVTARGPTLNFGNVYFGLSGRFVSAFDELGFWEYLPSFTYLDFAGSGQTTVDSLIPDTISMPYVGSFNYCELNSPRDRLNNCFMTPASQIIKRVECRSLKHTMVLSRK